MTEDDSDRPLDITRRLADGEDVDLSAENEGLDTELAHGLEKLRKVMGTPVGSPSDATQTQSLGNTPPPAPSQPDADRRIAGFKLIRKLGEGGMGVVWEAEQDRPRRRVALKVIRGGAHVDETTLKLFQREVQTLARLQHPGIAALYESGATEDGLHWFAMELVRGVTLRQWLDRRPEGAVTPAELRLRLQVFRKVCDAVAYAHQRGVIHRDLKPANVLVPMGDNAAAIAVPDVKVLDFGLARITESDTGMTSYHTEIGRVRGTLPYMSPEQVRGNPAEIDLRTDVYALGVMLYEMVTGKLPLDLSRASLIDAMRVICEEPPRSISATFTGTRRLDPDVATIVGKALEKDAERRYTTAAALGEDVDRWLHDQPIQGRPPSATYQFRKLVARHKLPFAFAGAVFVLLAVFAGVMTVQATRIARERDRANQEAKRATDEAKRATEEAATAKSVSDFLEGMFKVADPAESRGATITAEEILDRGAAKIELELKGQEAIQARLMLTMGSVYSNLGFATKAEPLLRGALEKRRSLFGENSYETAEAMSMLGWYGGGTEALDLSERALAVAARRLDAADPRLAWIRVRRAGALRNHNRLADAREQLEDALAAFRSKVVPDSTGVIWCLTELGVVSALKVDHERALSYFEEALAIRRRTLPRNHPDLANGLNNVANELLELGRPEQARRLSEEAVAASEQSNGPTHGWTGGFLCTLARIEHRLGDLAAADRDSARALSVMETSWGPSNAAVAEGLLTRAQVQRDLGRLGDSEATFRKLLPILEDTELEGGPVLLGAALREYTVLLKKQGRTAAAAQTEARIRALEQKRGA